MKRYASDLSVPEILIVDDDPSVILALRKVLSEVGNCHFANNGLEALERVQSAPPSLILLDIQLPGMDGLEVCKQLKASPRTADIPVLFITSHVDMDIEEQVFLAGAADYIAKPLNPRVVSARVKIHLGYQQALGVLALQAFRDGLTGINNRRRFDEQLELEWKRAQRHKWPLSLLMVDIDEFKKYNDHFGHLEGDAALKSVATALAGSTKRPADFVARYGGEEFALILPDSDAEGAQAIADIVLGKVLNLCRAHAPEATRPYVTVSVGYSTFYPADAEVSGLQPDQLIKSADAALYQSKKNGRNCSTYQPLHGTGVAIADAR